MSRFRRSIMGSGGLPNGIMLNGSQAQALDVLFSSNDGEQLCIVHGQENWPNSGYTPVGIVVVPGTHNRYGDGTCGVMSLVSVDGFCDKKIGKLRIGMYVYSPDQMDNINMKFYNGEPIDNYGRGTTPDDYFYGANWSYYGEHITNVFYGNNIFTGQTSSVCIPTQTNSNSTDVSYIRTDLPSIAWPYVSDTANTITTEASVEYKNAARVPGGNYVWARTGLAGCDFNGIRNTAAVYVYGGGLDFYNDEIDRNRDFAYSQGSVGPGSPAFIVTSYYKTIGTNSFVEAYANVTTLDVYSGTSNSSIDNRGFWYFPAIGELCYILPKRFEINKIIYALNLKYGNVGSLIGVYNAVYQSSDECDNNYIWVLWPSEGYISRSDKYSQWFIRPFLRF